MAIVGLGAITLIFGLLLILLSARATVAPIRAVKAGMSRIEEGDLDAAVVVYDGTELGELQSGFNRMADGLRERERIRDLFGRHVGHDVAEAALVEPRVWVAKSVRSPSSSSISSAPPNWPRPDPQGRSSTSSTASSKSSSTRWIVMVGSSTSSKATRRSPSSAHPGISTTPPGMPSRRHA